MRSCVPFGWHTARTFIIIITKLSQYLVNCGAHSPLLLSLFLSCTEYVICRHCGSDITVSNFFEEKLSPLALSFTNQTFYDTKSVLIQTLENPLGIRFKVVVTKKAHCARISSRVSSPRDSNAVEIRMQFNRILSSNFPMPIPVEL